MQIPLYSGFAAIVRIAFRLQVSNKHLAKTVEIMAAIYLNYPGRMAYGGF
jgi:hypothetical protein